MSWTTANSVATGDQDTARSPANRNGQVAVVWEDDRDTTDPDDDAHSDVWLRMFRNGVAGVRDQAVGRRDPARPGSTSA